MSRLKYMNEKIQLLKILAGVTEAGSVKASGLGVTLSHSDVHGWSQGEQGTHSLALGTS